MKIEWIVSGASPFWVEENYQDGGCIYDTYTRKILRTLYDLEVTYIYRGNSDSTIKRIFQIDRIHETEVPKIGEPRVITV